MFQAIGLSVLCGGGRDEKAEAAFALCDYNGDGVITLDEMTRFLTSVFSVMYDAEPSTVETMVMGVEQLASVTASEAILEADLDHDGNLSFEEFQRWYSQMPGEGSGATLSSEVGQYVEEAPSLVSLGELRRLTHLGQQSVHDVFELFAEATDEDGTISRASFDGCFEELASNAGATSPATADADKLRVVLSGLYTLFDANGDGVVDFTELTSGLSILCGGDRDEKAAAAFALYDYNGDGVINLEEMTRFLTASQFSVSI